MKLNTVPGFKMARWLAAVAAAMALAACGGGSDSQQAPVRLEADKLLGGWRTETPGEVEYEFSPSSINASAELEAVKTGRIVVGGEVQARFHWSVNSNGEAMLTKVDPICNLPDLRQCPAVGTERIKVALRVGPQDYAWTIESTPAGASAPSTRELNFRPATLSRSTVPGGRFLMTKAAQFSYANPAGSDGQFMQMGLLDTSVPHVLTIPLPPTPMRAMPVLTGKDEAVDTQLTVPHPVTGEPVTVKVKEWLENAVLMAGASNNLLVSYELHRKVDLPAGMDRAALGVDVYEKPHRATSAFSIVNQFVRGPEVKAGDRFFGTFPGAFDAQFTIDGIGNTLEFSSATRGVMKYVDVIQGRHSESRGFSWSRDDSGAIALELDDMPGRVSKYRLRFVKEIKGGYSAVLSFTARDGSDLDLMTDIIRDAKPVLDPKTFPGSYYMPSVDGVSLVKVNFRPDGSLDGGTVGGHWFIDTDGELVSFECISKQGVSEPSFQVCHDAFTDPAKLDTYRFAHVRRLRFVWGEGANYQVKYSAVIYGEDAGIVGRDYYGINWTYRIRKAGAN
ncbi:hypothetical protein [Pelomonas sp. BJYL3]|uniref:hypothetical protein n=1 Tax=Pelomonas sp. BJYL3 TaxID=2976697 RepID=UPI0022B4ADBD|nr:hypothetical protein [Pelomonas sp. BJYL3]